MRTLSEAPAAHQRPPLTKRLSPRHWAALDYVVGAVFGLILFATIRRGVVRAIESPYGFVSYRPLSFTWPLAMFLVMVAVVAVGMRRRRPAFMLGVLLAGSVVVTTLIGPENGALTYFLPVAYVLYLVAATYERRQAAVRVLIAVFATLVADAVLIYVTGGGFLPNGGLVSVALCVIIAWFTGYIVRQRRRYAVRLQDEAASKAVAEERLRIARELHDVVAHSMSVIAVQAGYGQYVIDTQPADARNALGAIQATSREALDEMRRMLGALRQADETDQRDWPRGAPATDRRPRAGRRRRAGYRRRALRTPRLAGSAGFEGLRGSRVRAAVPRARAGRPGPAALAHRERGRPGGRDALRAAQGTARQHRPVGLPDRAGSADQRGQARPHELVPRADRLRPRRADPRGDGQRRGPARRWPAPGYRTTGAPWPWPEALAGDAGLERQAGPTLLATSGMPGWHAARRPPIGGSGHGIIGMRERVSLLGGEFSAGPLPGYGFQVSAHIPLPPGSPQG